VVALAGGALVTWILSMGGLPFQPTWLIVSVLLLAIPGVLHLVFRRDQDGGEGPGPDVESDAGDRSGGEPERDPGGRPGGRPDDVPERDPGEEQ
ncbi:MAG TPA: hypothetical protein VK966_00475, partial [Longimicrobiales bacterium]|nr:hypothetical protein [Longimicrobiales bacterium]